MARFTLNSILWNLSNHNKESYLKDIYKKFLIERDSENLVVGILCARYYVKSSESTMKPS